MNNDLISICLCTFVKNEKRFNDLKQVLKSLQSNLVKPVEIIIVDDVSPFVGVRELLETFAYETKTIFGISVRVCFNEKNIGHARSQNKSMGFAEGNVICHLEDDIILQQEGWNQIFAKALRDHPEVGMVYPLHNGRGEGIFRPGYVEHSWALGGVWAINRDVYEQLFPAIWSTDLVHQLEPEMCLRIRMLGYRLGGVLEIPTMVHLGEGDDQETFGRKLQMTIGVYNFLQKWNRRFMGFWDYRSVWSMSWDDLPPNIAFRRMVAAALGQRINENPEPFQFKGNWGKYELVHLIRPPGREREKELVEKMQNNFVFKDEPELHVQILNLAQRMNVKEWQGFDMTKAECVKAYLRGKAFDYKWRCDVIPDDMSKPSIHDLK